MTVRRGQCLCGAVRWETSAPVLWSGHCHCGSCRRATSAPFTSFFGVARERVTWTGQMTDIASTDGQVVRKFCATCGTHMTYQNTRWPNETHLYATSMDDPSLFTPKAHFHYAEKLDWVEMNDDLPRYARSAEGADPI